VRCLVTFIFLLTTLVAIGLSLLAPESVFTYPLQLLAVVFLVVVVIDRLFGMFRPRRGTKTPPSQIAEMERLYFRSMREMLSDEPNLVQIINDLQRIIAIDPQYKNARHYLNRAVFLQSESRVTKAQTRLPSRNSIEFKKLQDQLIDPDPAVRKAVVMELIQYGEDAVDPLIALLMDEDADVRVHAATGLGWVGGADAVQPLIVALQDENAYVRRYAARAMCWVVDSSAVDGLIESLKDNDNYVRRYAARALGWSQDRRVISPLLDLLLVEENNDVREYALTALEDLGEHNVRMDRQPELVE
jgi:bilin biosynthesis protein